MITNLRKNYRLTIEFFTARFNTIVLSFVLLLGILIGYPGIAAAKSLKSVPFDSSSSVVNVATIYETSPENQKGVIKSTKSSKSLLKKALGFENMSVLKSEDGNKVIVLSQWQDLASYKAYNSQLALAETSDKSSKSKSKDKEVVAIAPARTVVFEIEKIQAVEGIIPAIRGKEAVVQLSEFTLKNPEDQPKVIDSVEKMMPNIMLKKPAPQAAILLRSVDNTEVALLANWNCSAEFEDVGQPAAFDQPDADLVALADNDQHLYDVAGIISHKAKEDKESKEFKKSDD